MNWKHYFTTSIGKKLLVGATGLFLILFLLVHCYVNAMIFFNDGGARFNEAAHFMGTNVLIRTVEIGLFAALLLHIIQSLMLWAQNRARRNVRYAVNAGNQTSRWYSRSMALLGTLILLFLVMHLAHFWVPNRYSQTFTAEHEELPLYEMMLETFTNPVVVIIYVLGCFSLAWHLLHGFYSSLQTFGLGTYKYKGMIKSIGTAFAIIIPIIFALMPIAMYLGWVA